MIKYWKAWFFSILAKSDAELLKQQLFNDFWQYLSIGHYYETLFCHTFLISNWNLKYFKFIFILCFFMPLKDFPIEFRFTCSKIYLNPIKINIKPTLWYFRLTLELEFSFIFISFASVIFKYFWQSITTCAYNPCSVAIWFMSFSTSSGKNLSSLALLLYFYI